LKCAKISLKRYDKVTHFFGCCFILSKHVFYQVFTKAVNVAINSMDESDINECCNGNMKSQLGSSIQVAYDNMVVRTEEKMRQTYSQICELHNVEEVLRTAMNANTDSTLSVENAESSLNKVVLEARQKEKEQLTAAIQQLDGEVKKSKEMLSRLRAQVQNEIAAATEECQKMSIAAAQCGVQIGNQ
jgi:vacuolar-type H+-ATPase subunit H